MVYAEDKVEFHKDMYDKGLFNYKINTKNQKEYYLPITDIAPDSYQYTKYYGFDLLHDERLDTFFKELSLLGI